MAVTWKDRSRFKPSVIIKKIDNVRVVNPSGGAAFTGFELEDCLPALQSMLKFPEAVIEIDKADLVWRGLTGVSGDLTPESFLASINKELSDVLATKEQDYRLLTSISIDGRDVPRKLQVCGAEIRLLPAEYPNRFKSRYELLERYAYVVAPAPSNYCKVIVGVKAKSPNGAVNRAFRALDLQRALWCLMGNPRLQLTHGVASHSPINVVRLGSQHTLHFSQGKTAGDGIWYDPGFVEARIYRIPKPDVVRKNSRWALRQVTACRYGETLISALVMFVRALDEKNADTAFLRLWGAVEMLTTPFQANHERIVNRCSYLFKDRDYHRQLLEHLREYRNAHVHRGEESRRARTHCYQLQLYFVNLIWFHVYNAKYFKSLDEANDFLDLPSDKEVLKRNLSLARKAIRFIS